MSFPFLLVVFIYRLRRAALSFANDRAAVREEPRCSSRTANNFYKRKVTNKCANIQANAMFFRSLIRIFMTNQEDTFARCK